MKYLLIVAAIAITSCSSLSHVDSRLPIKDYEYRLVAYGDSTNTYDLYTAYGCLIATNFTAAQIDSIINDDNE